MDEAARESFKLQLSPELVTERRFARSHADHLPAPLRLSAVFEFRPLLKIFSDSRVKKGCHLRYPAWVGMADAEIRAALDRHWAASNAGDDAGEGDIYLDDVELEYPQSGERFRGRRNVLESRGHNPAGRRFEVRRTLGSGALWVVEYVIFYDGRPVPTVSIMEFRDGKVARETQYFADPFAAPVWRARWRETER